VFAARLLYTVLQAACQQSSSWMDHLMQKVVRAHGLIHGRDDPWANWLPIGLTR
jgi:hypothetical protein